MAKFIRYGSTENSWGWEDRNIGVEVKGKVAEQDEGGVQEDKGPNIPQLAGIGAP